MGEHAGPARLIGTVCIEEEPVAAGEPPAATRRAGGSPSVSIIRGATALLSTQPITWAASLITAVLVPGLLGDQALGQYTLAVTITGLVVMATSLGIPDYLVRRVAAQPALAALDGGGALVLVVSVALVVAVALALVLPALGLSIPPNLLQVALAGMVISAALAVLSSLLRGQERYARFAWWNAGTALGGTCAGIGALVAGGDVTAYLAATVAMSSVMMVGGWYASGFRLQSTAFDPRLWRELAVGGLPFLGWYMALHMYGEIDKILLAVLSRDAVIGWYAAAYRIIGLPVFIPTLITTPLLPVLSRHARDRAVFEQTLRGSIRVVVILTVPICAMLVALAPAVPELLHWPSAFHNSVPLMAILALHLPIVAVDMVLGTALIALRRERSWLGVAVLASIFNPAMNFFLIPYFEHLLYNGAIGAAIVTVVTELLMLGGALLLLPRGLIDRATIERSGGAIAAGICLALATAELRPLSLPLAIAAGGGVFIASAMVLRVVRPGDLAAARQVVLQALTR